MKTFSLFITVLLFANFAKASNKTIADTTGWEFSAHTAIPHMGTSRSIIGSNYSIVYNGESLSVYLPYFGRAYAGADIYTGRNPLDFRSKEFSIESKPMKKGGMRYIIHPKDNSEVQTMTISAFDNGNADLDVTMSSRSSITFYGTISMLKK